MSSQPHDNKVVTPASRRVTIQQPPANTQQNPKLWKTRFFGGFSFESESLQEFSEFDDASDTATTVDSQKLRRPSDGQMAPVTTIETVTITRPLKVIAFICGVFAGILLTMGLASSEWLIASGYRQGLFVYCVGPNETENTVPFANGNKEASKEGCHRINLQTQAYTLVAAGFCALSLFVDVFATLLTVLGLRCRDPNRKYKYYRIAVYVMAISLVAVLVALVVYPVCFSHIITSSQRPLWEFGWAYGVGWGASIFLFGGVILLLCDKESEEIYYKERTIVQYADSNTKA